MTLYFWLIKNRAENLKVGKNPNLWASGAILFEGPWAPRKSLGSQAQSSTKCRFRLVGTPWLGPQSRSPEWPEGAMLSIGMPVFRLYRSGQIIMIH